MRGSFSAVRTATIARLVVVGLFCGIFRNLHDPHSFAPLRLQNFSKKRHNFSAFEEIEWLFIELHSKFRFFIENAVFLSDFDENFSEFHEHVQNIKIVNIEYSKNFILQNIEKIP